MAHDSLTEEREGAARNQALFREVNERIEELEPALSVVQFLCECDQRDCTAHIPLTLAEYEDVRGIPNHFFVLPGHQHSSVEVVAASNDRYLIVAKLGVGAAVAARLDPRQRR